MDTQTAFNIVLSLVAFLGGWVLNSIRDSIARLQATDNALADKVQHIEVLVAGKYVTRDDLQALFGKLDRIEAKLDKKVDK